MILLTKVPFHKLIEPAPQDEEDGEVSEDESEDEDEGETKTAVVTDTTNSTDAAISTPDKNKLLGQ